MANKAKENKAKRAAKRSLRHGPRRVSVSQADPGVATLIPPAAPVHASLPPDYYAFEIGGKVVPLGELTADGLASALRKPVKVAYVTAGKPHAVTLDLTRDHGVRVFVTRLLESKRREHAGSASVEPAVIEIIAEPDFHEPTPVKSILKPHSGAGADSVGASARPSYASVAQAAPDPRAIRAARREAKSAGRKPPEQASGTARERRAARRLAAGITKMEAWSPPEHVGPTDFVPPELELPRVVYPRPDKPPTDYKSPGKASDLAPFTLKEFTKVSKAARDALADYNRLVYQQDAGKDGNVAAQAAVEAYGNIDDYIEVMWRNYRSRIPRNWRGNLPKLKAINDREKGVSVPKPKVGLAKPEAFKLPKHVFASYYLRKTGKIVVVGAGNLDSWKVVESGREDVFVLQPFKGPEATEGVPPRFGGMTGDPSQVDDVSDLDPSGPYARLARKGQLCNYSLRDLVHPALVSTPTMVFPDSFDCLTEEDLLWFVDWYKTRETEPVVYAGRFMGHIPDFHADESLEGWLTQEEGAPKKIEALRSGPEFAEVRMSYNATLRRKDVIEIDSASRGKVKITFERISVELEGMTTQQHRDLTAVDYEISRVRVSAPSAVYLKPATSGLMGSTDNQAGQEFLERLYSGYSTVTIRDRRAFMKLYGGVTLEDIADIEQEFPTVKANFDMLGMDSTRGFAAEFVGKHGRTLKCGPSLTGDALFERVDAFFLDEDDSSSTTTSEASTVPTVPRRPSVTFEDSMSGGEPRALLPQARKQPKVLVHTVTSPHGTVSFETDGEPEYNPPEQAAARAIISATPNILDGPRTFNAVRSGLTAAARSNKVNLSSINQAAVAEEVKNINVQSFVTSSAIVRGTAEGIADTVLPGSVDWFKSKLEILKETVLGYRKSRPKTNRFQRRSALAHWGDERDKAFLPNWVTFPWALAREAGRLRLPYLLLLVPTFRTFSTLWYATLFCSFTSWSVWVDDQRRNGFVDPDIPKTRFITIIGSVLAESAKSAFRARNAE